MHMCPLMEPHLSCSLSKSSLWHMHAMCALCVITSTQECRGTWTSATIHHLLPVGYWKVKCALAIPCYALLAMYCTTVMVPMFQAAIP